MEMKLRVLGGRRFNDEIEGKRYDFFKLRIEMPVPRTAENEFGTNVVEVNMGKAEMYAEFKAKYACPCEAYVDLEPSSKGFDVVGIRPVEVAKVKAAA